LQFSIADLISDSTRNTLAPSVAYLRKQGPEDISPEKCKPAEIGTAPYSKILSDTMFDIECKSNSPVEAGMKNFLCQLLKNKLVFKDKQTEEDNLEVRTE
jgi:hypothetical protein